LDPSIDKANERTGKWTADEYIKLKDAVQTHGGKNWGAIAALVPGRTKNQCRHRWHDVLNSSIARASGRTGKWTEDEDSKLRNAVHRHGGKDWAAISALVPDRTIHQCSSRWHDALNPASIDGANGRTGKWSKDEDSKLKDAVQTHCGKDWAAISALVPGRTKKQCLSRWYDALNPNISLTGRHTGKWTAVEDSKLKDAIQEHGDKNWGAIAALVQTRTGKQCSSRWHDVLNPASIDGANARTGKWTEDEDSKLKDAVVTHGDKTWKKVAALVPGRTKKQCCNRWRDMKPNGRSF
jgi:myb proto-oncogene protein